MEQLLGWMANVVKVSSCDSVGKKRAMAQTSKKQSSLWSTYIQPNRQPPCHSISQLQNQAGITSHDGQTALSIFLAQGILSRYYLCEKRDWESDKQRERECTPIHWFTPQCLIAKIWLKPELEAKNLVQVTKEGDVEALQASYWLKVKHQPRAWSISIT